MSAADTKTPRLDAAVEQIAGLLVAAKLYEVGARVERARGDEVEYALAVAMTAAARASQEIRWNREAGAEQIERAMRLDLIATAAAWIRSGSNVANAYAPETAERFATLATGLLDAVPTLTASPYRAVELPWIWGRPNERVVAAHAAAHPIQGARGLGFWLAVNDAGEAGPDPGILALGVRGGESCLVTFDGGGERACSLAVERWTQTTRFLALSAVGIPTCFLYPAPAVDPLAKPIRHVDTEPALAAAQRLLAADPEAAAILEAMIRERDHHLARVTELLDANTAAKMRQRALARLVETVRCQHCAWRGTPAQTGTLGDLLMCPGCGRAGVWMT